MDYRETPPPPSLDGFVAIWTLDVGGADTAAASGYADQAHMTREFRALGGLSPGTARRRAAGPFVPSRDEPPPDG
jgi:hypothetical protein